MKEGRNKGRSTGRKERRKKGIDGCMGGGRESGINESLPKTE